MICQICGNNSNNKVHSIKEMMFGFRDEFAYIECSKCGCLQIEEIPKNINKYYPNNYYSFQSVGMRDNYVKRFFKNKLYMYLIFKKSFIGRILSCQYPTPILDCIGNCQVDYDSKILDVGCGAGHLLYSLRDVGFKDLVGIDPYVESEVIINNFNILKMDINELPESQKFDLIMFNHSFEHMPNPKEILSKVRRLLKKDGTCLISIPVKTKYVWERYGVNWVQIDAPRHFFLYTPESFRLLVEKTGLHVCNEIFNSTDFLFWGSEQYRSGIPLTSERSHSKNKKNSIFSKKDIENYKRMSEKLNMNKEGDSATFLVQRQN